LGIARSAGIRATPRSAVLRLLASALELYGQELGLLPAVCDPLGVNVSLSFVEDFPPVVERKGQLDGHRSAAKWPCGVYFVSVVVRVLLSLWPWVGV
jgi:hypothetical protein